MKIPLVRIGNSQGIRIPKSIIEQCGLKGEVEITVRDNTIVIAAIPPLRQGWSDAFRRMAEAGDDVQLIPDTQSGRWDETEWTW